MHLISIKATSRPNQVFLSFDNNIAIPFFVDDVVAFHLLKGQEVDDNLFCKIIHSSLFFLLKNYSLRLIAISSRSKKDLNFRLKNYLHKTLKKFNLSAENSQEVITRVINFLESKDLLRDEDFIDSFIRKNKNKSVKHLEFLLEKQGVCKELVFSKLKNQNDLEKLKKLILKIDPRKLKDYKAKNKLIASFCRKGFSYEDIKGLIDSVALSQ